VFKKSVFERVLFSLSSLADELTDGQEFDEADDVKTAILMLQALNRGGLVEDDSVESEPVTGDMETLRQLCVQMKDLQLKALALKAEAAAIREPLDELRLRKIPDLMASLEVKTTTFTGLGRVQLAADLYASTISGQKEAAMRWLRDCGYGDMIKPTVNASSLKALFRQQIKAGAMPPDDIFKITPFTRASLVKA
jgi:hypothetical protein